MITTVSSKSKTVQIGPELPIVVIGERINPTGKKKLTQAIKQGDLEIIKSEATRQVEAGAHMLDVNVGVPGIDEPKVLLEALQIVQSVTDVPLVLDSGRLDVLKTALASFEGKPLVNSVDGDAEKIVTLLPAVKEAGAAVVGLTMNEKGIPSTPEGRLEIAKKIIARAEDFGIPREDVIIDCLCMTVSAEHDVGLVTLEAMKLVKEELGVNMTLGVSNISFGLPDREFVNHVFLAMAVQAGLTCAIIDPTVEEMKMAVLAADLLRGKDEWCENYLNAYRGKLKKD